MVLDDNQKIGVGLIVLGCCFLTLGVVLMFDRTFIAIGDAMFLIGLISLIGAKRTLTLFTRKDKIRGTVCLALGIIAVIWLRWGLIGMIFQTFGAFNLFMNFLPSMLAVARQIPYIGVVLDAPGVSHALDFIAGKTRPKYSV